MKRTHEAIKTETAKVNTICVGITHCIDNTNTRDQPLTLSVAVATISVHE